MVSFRPEMNIEAAKEFLQIIKWDKATDVAPIDMGELSRVYSFTSDQREYVVHFKSDCSSLDIANYMYTQYAVYGIPIPKVVEIGSCGDLYYGISEKVPGKPMSTFPEKELEKLLNKLAETYTRINTIKIDKDKGFGLISLSGKALFHTWRECLEDFFNKESSFYGDWTKLYVESFLERDVFEEIYQKMLELSKYSPKDPSLVHGDFHLGNMLSDGEKITGIVDWEMARYGDFMSDLGVMHFWTPSLQFPQRVREAWEREGRSIPFFEERLLCHQLFVGVDGLRFFAKKGDREAYHSIKNKLYDLLK